MEFFTNMNFRKVVSIIIVYYFANLKEQVNDKRQASIAFRI